MKTVLVTGASSGIGEATVRKLLREGYTVRAADRADARPRGARRDRPVDGRHEGRRNRGRCRADRRRARRRRRPRQQRGLRHVRGDGGHVPGGRSVPVRSEPLRGGAPHPAGAAPDARAARGHDRERLVDGRQDLHAARFYHATKHALEGWSDCLRLELAPFGINVVVVEPGAIETEFGDVLVDPMLERSGSTAYGELAHTMAKATRQSYEAGNGSPASVVADTIAKAVAARRPSTRYATGKYAKTMIRMRKWLGDRMFDRIIMRFV